MPDKPPRVFISYAQEGEAHAAWVRALADELIRDGIDTVIDQREEWPEQGWRRWMDKQIAAADWVLVVCTPEYRRRFDDNVDAPFPEGRGVRWESQHITQELYDRKFRNRRFVPVLPPMADEADIPVPLQDYRKFRLGETFQIRADDCDHEGFTALYRLLTGQPPYPAPEPGAIRPLPPLTEAAVRPPGGAEQEAAPARVINIPNPYPGLAAFGADRQRFFFGRDEDIPRVVSRLAEGQFVCVVGASGTGKSSLIAAGVAPALRRQHPGLSYLRFTPKRDPLVQFADALDRLLPEDRLAFDEGDRRGRIADAVGRDPAAAVGEYLVQLSRPALVFADQFEELFTLTAEAGRVGFKRVFDALAAAEGVMLVLTLRSEFYARLSEWLHHPALETRLVNLEPIRDEAGLAEVIRRPAEESGVAIDTAVVADLVRQAGAMTNSLPLLALTLRRLFERRDPVQGITPATLADTGGIAHSVAAAADPVDKAIDARPARAMACARLFAALATVVEGVTIRRTAEVAALRADPEIAILVDAMRTQGLLTDLDEAHVAIAHEAVFTHWPRLTDWCQHFAVKLDLRRQAELAARDWHQAVAAERGDMQSSRQRRSDALRWGWERQKPAIEALLELRQREPELDRDYVDPGIHAWRALENELGDDLRSFLYPEPLRLIDELASDDTPHTRREDIGRRLDAMGDPRRGVGLDDEGLPDIAWERIAEGGEVILETDPPRAFTVAPFWIARYPVTWAQYRAFVDAEDGYQDARWWHGLKQEHKPGDPLWAFANHPGVKVSWCDAMAFCRWLNARLGLQAEEAVRLPTEWEWQWVAQAGKARLTYPWGYNWNPARANSIDSGVRRTVAVGLYRNEPLDGMQVLDLAGNVWEWCLNEYEKPENAGLESDAYRVLRGGSWFSDPDYCRAAGRGGYWPGGRYDFIGFRVCRGSPIDPRGAGSLDTEAPDR